MQKCAPRRITWQQMEAANYGRAHTKGDDSDLEELGIATSYESVLRQAEAAAEVARLLGIDMRTPAGKARDADHEYYNEEFFLTGGEPLDEAQIARNSQGLALAREALEHRHDPSS